MMNKAKSLENDINANIIICTAYPNKQTPTIRIHKFGRIANKIFLTNEGQKFSEKWKTLYNPETGIEHLDEIFMYILINFKLFFIAEGVEEMEEELARLITNTVLEMETGPKQCEDRSRQNTSNGKLGNSSRSNLINITIKLLD